MKRTIRLACAALATSFALAANASVVTFDGDPALSWAGGTFTYGLSGDYLDGFFTQGAASTSAYNGYGQSGESIGFNSPVTLESLDLMECGFCQGGAPVDYTVALFDRFGVPLTSQTVLPTTSPQTLVFDTPGVSTVTFTFDGGSNLFGDGRSVAWYVVSNVTFDDVPEPAAWSLMLLGVAAAGSLARHSRARRGRMA